MQPRRNDVTRRYLPNMHVLQYCSNMSSGKNLPEVIGSQNFCEKFETATQERSLPLSAFTWTFDQCYFTKGFWILMSVILSKIMLAAVILLTEIQHQQKSLLTIIFTYDLDSNWIFLNYFLVELFVPFGL